MIFRIQRCLFVQLSPDTYAVFHDIMRACANAYHITLGLGILQPELARTLIKVIFCGARESYCETCLKRIETRITCDGEFHDAPPYFSLALDCCVGLGMTSTCQ